MRNNLLHPGLYPADKKRESKDGGLLFKCDTGSGLILDCKWYFSGNPEETTFLSLYSEWVIGRPFDEVSILSAESVAECLQLDKTRVSDALSALFSS